MKRDRNRFYHSSIFAAFLAIGALAMSVSHASACMDCSQLENAMAASDREFHDSGVTQATADVLSAWDTDFAASLREMVLHPTGATRASQQFRQARAAQLVQQIDRITAQLNIRSGDWVAKEIPAAFEQGLKRATRQAIDAGIIKPNSPIVGSFSVINEHAVQVLASDTASDLRRASDAMADQAKKAVSGIAKLTPDATSQILIATKQGKLPEARVNAIIARGIVSGNPVQQAAELTKALTAVHGETTPITGKDGVTRNYGTKDYADLVARTKTRQAVVIANNNRLQESGIDLVAIVGRVSPNFCSAFLGQVFSISGKNDKYPALASLPGGGPPFHPNCSKSTRPFIDYLANDKQLKLADGLEDAQQLLGKNATEAQRLFKDLQIKSQVESQYTKTITKIFGTGPAVGDRSKPV